MAEQLTIIGRLRAKLGREAELRSALLETLEASRQEFGCINYDLHVSLETPGLFVLYENWTSEAALAAHFEAVHSKALAAHLPDLLAEPLAMERLREISPWVGRRQPDTEEVADA